MGNDACRLSAGRLGLARRRPCGGLPVRLLVLAIAVVLAGCDTAAVVTPSPSLPSDGPTPAATAGGPATGSPGSPTGSSGAVTPSPAPSGSPRSAPSSASVAYHVVRGDTLASIARRFATTARSIAFWNRDQYPTLDPTSSSYAPDRIEVGWTLIVIPGTVVDEQELPVPTVTPQPTISIAPSAVPSGPVSALISNGSRASNVVALTFDIGGRLDPALDIVDWLVANGVHATIFPTGASGSGTATGKAVLAAVAAHPELFSVGNHSWDHPDFTTLSATAIASQLTRTEQAIAPLVGRSTQPFFRPPYGAVNLAVRTAVGAAGWRYTILWDVDTIDWKPTSDGGPTADDIVAKVVARARAGSIVLMHLGGYHTLEALPRVVDGLRAQGLEQAAVSP